MKVTLLLLALASLSYAQFLSNPLRIYTNQPNVTVKKFGAAVTTCSITMVIMDNTTQCIKYLNGNGFVYDWQCTPETAAATDILVYGSAAYTTNPTGQLVILDMYSGDDIAVIGPAQTGVSSPFKMTLYSSFSSHTLTHTWLMANGSTNTSIYLPNWTITHPGNVFTYGNRLVTRLTNSSPMKCFFAPASNVVMFSFENDPTMIIAWDTSSSPKYLYNISGFTNIEACSADYYNRLYIWDAGVLKVLTQQGVSLHNLTLPDVQGTPRGIYPTRNRVYFHDNVGVIRYDFPGLQVTFVQPTNPTCPTGGSSAFYQITNGNPPFTTRLIPDQQISTIGDKMFAINSTFNNINVRLPFNMTMSLYNDAIAPEFESFTLTPGGVSDPSTPNSEFPTHSGANSWKMLMSNRSHYQLRANTVLTGARIMANYFSTLEMWVNVGPGIGRWTIDLTGITQPPNSWYYFNYDEDDFEPYTWTKISIDLSRGNIGQQYSRISFMDYSNTTSNSTFLYIDDIRLLPYNTTDRMMIVTDFCNVTFTTPYIPITSSNVLSVEVDQKGVSCPAAGSNGNKSLDGELHATVTGGVGSVSIAWSLGPSNAAGLNGTDVRGLAALEDKNIVIYENAIGPSITDRSSGNYNLSDSSYSFAGTYSASFVPESATDFLSFQLQAFTMAKHPAIEFYVNGGAEGGQLIYVGLINAQSTISNQQLIHRILTIPSIPARVWTKVRYPLTAGTWYGFVISGVSGLSQSRVYFDNIKVVNNELNVTVTDASNCKVTNFNIGVPTPKPLIVTPTVNNMMCYNSTNGVINLSVSGGTSPYTYNWTTQSGAVNSSSIANLADAVYTVRVTDNNDCVPAVVSAEILRPPALTIAYKTRSPLCYGGTGGLTANVRGGIEPFYFSWNSTATGFNGPTPQSAPFSVFSDSLASLYTFDNRTNTSVVCNGANLKQNGVMSSQSGYCSLLVNPGVSDTTLFGVGCTDCIDFSQNPALKFWINLIDPREVNLLEFAFTKNDVSIYSQQLNLTNTTGWQSVVIRFPAQGIADSFTITKSNGNAGIFMLDSISLMPSASFSAGFAVKTGFDGVVDGAAGIYTLSITDANSCPVVAYLEITQPSQISVYVSIVVPSIEGASDGTATANVSGGIPPYTYSWSHGNETKNADGLAAGPYTFVVTDSNGCSRSISITVGSGPAPFDPSAQKLIRPYSPAVATGFGVIIGIGVLVGIMSAIILAFRWDRFSTYGPFYCGIINFGVIISYAAAAVVLPDPTDELCLAFPWLLGIAFNLVYGCLFIKTWVLYRVFRQATQMKKTNLTPFYILRVLSLFVGIEVAFMLIWTFVNPPKAGYADLLDNRKELQCINDTPIFWVIFLAIKGAWLIFGAILAFLTRNIVKEYNESKSIAYAIYNDIVLIIIAIPLALTLREVPRGVVVVEAAVVFMSFTFTIMLLFFPIWWGIFFSGVDISTITMKRAARTPNSGTSSTGHSPTHSNNSSNGSKEVYSL